MAKVWSGLVSPRDSREGVFSITASAPVVTEPSLLRHTPAASLQPGPPGYIRGHPKSPNPLPIPGSGPRSRLHSPTFATEVAVTGSRLRAWVSAGARAQLPHTREMNYVSNKSGEMVFFFSFQKATEARHKEKDKLGDVKVKTDKRPEPSTNATTPQG